ncbi:MAG: tetratricopeptide repeat protein [Myxococcota bacterium]
MRASVCVVALVGLVAIPAVGQDEDGLARARVLFEEGQALYSAGRYAAAAERMKEAYGISRAPELAFNVGRAYDRAGSLDEAAVYYRIYLEQADPPPDERESLERRVAEIETRRRKETESEARQRKEAETGPAETPGRSRRDEPELLRLSLSFNLGLGGQAQLDFEPPAYGIDRTREDLDATLGGTFRVERTVVPHLAVGALVELASYDMSDSERGGDLTLDADLWLKGSLSVPVGNREMELYVGVPFGFTLFRPDDDRLENLRGFNVGAIGGAELAFGPVGVFLEGGWRHRQVFDSFVAPLFETEHDATLTTNQGTLSAGMSVYLR